MGYAALFLNNADRHSRNGKQNTLAPLLLVTLRASLFPALLLPAVTHAQELGEIGRIQTITLSPDGEAQVDPSAKIQIITRPAPNAIAAKKVIANPPATQPAKAAPVVTAPRKVAAVAPKVEPKAIQAPGVAPAGKTPTKTPVNTQKKQPDFQPVSADLLSKRAQLPGTNNAVEDSYTDALIDPSIAEDPLDYSPYIDGVNEKRGVRTLSLEARSRRFKISGDDEAVEDHAIALGYSHETMNYGQFRFDISAFRRNNGREFGRNSQSGSINDIGNILLQQLRMPLTRSLLADNALGVQRVNRSYLNRIGNRSFLRYPLMRGGSTRIYNINGDEFTAAYGKIGRYRPGLTTAYTTDNGKAALMSVTKRLGANWSLGGEAWRVTDRDDQTDNRQGYGLGTGYDNAKGNNHFSASVLGDNDERRAYTAEAGQTLNRYTQRYGGYYFDEGFQWLSEDIQSDAVGGYYNIQYNGGRLRSNASVDWSRFGVRRELSTSTFVGLGFNYRLNFRNSLALSGSARNTKRNNVGQRDNRDALIRSSLSHQHLNNSNSRIELSHQVNGLSGSGGDVRRSELLYGYSWNNSRATQFGLELGVNYETRQSDSVIRPQLGVSLQRSWRSGWYVGTGMRLSVSDSDSGSDQNEWSGYINSSIPLADAWTLSLEANYSQRKSQGTSLNNRSIGDTETNSVLLSLRYQHTSGTPLRSIGNRTGRFGSGDIRGVIFDDRNNDGIKQPLEDGLATVEVYLDRKILAITDAQGEFTFAGVSPGDHRIQVSEQTLPLPFVLNQANNIAVNVGLRDRRFVEIPANELVE